MYHEKTTQLEWKIKELKEGNSENEQLISKMFKLENGDFPQLYNSKDTLERREDSSKRDKKVREGFQSSSILEISNLTNDDEEEEFDSLQIGPKRRNYNEELNNPSSRVHK